jgi:hypothetical protein
VGGKKRSELARTSARLPVRGWRTKTEDKHKDKMSHVTCASCPRPAQHHSKRRGLSSRQHQIKSLKTIEPRNVQ